MLTRSVAGNYGQYTYSLDGQQNLTARYADPKGGVWTQTTSAIGNPTGRVDPLGNRETYSYVNYRPLEMVDPLGNSTSYSYDGIWIPARRARRPRKPPELRPGWVWQHRLDGERPWRAGHLSLRHECRACTRRQQVQRRTSTRNFFTCGRGVSGTSMVEASS